MKSNFSLMTIGISMLVLSPMLRMQAAHLTPEQALQRIKGSSTMSRISGNASSFVLAHTEEEDGNAMLYVFNKDDREFVVASADDAFPAVLGYSDNGAFDMDNASPEFIWWLGQYAKESAYFLKNNTGNQALHPVDRASRAFRRNIPEMLKTRWDQSEPYNLYCPYDSKGRSVTGCVATAMAQVVKYHAYPTQGAGQYSYDWNGKTLTFDYGNTTFDYSQMVDDYSKSYSTQAQKNAVAALMYACGVGVNMNYTSNESGASDLYVPYALKKYFKYDGATRLLKRNYFTDEDWDDMVYSELADGRPVVYGGQAPEGGHEFVCDGYENGYFHINWGWSGYYNGYFLLSALDPEHQGTGGYEGGYNSDQTMVCGAAPDKGGTPWYPIYASSGFEISNYHANDWVELRFLNEGGMYNYSPEAVKLSFYAKCVSETGQEYRSSTGYELSFAGATGTQTSGYVGVAVYMPSNLKEGKYKTYIEFQTPEGSWQELMIPIGEANYFNLTVDSKGQYSYGDGAPDEKAQLKVTAFEPATTIYSGEETKFLMTIENIGNVAFSGDIMMKIFEKDVKEDPLFIGRINLSVNAGRTLSGSVTFTLPMPDGYYDVIFYDGYDEVISDLYPIRIGEEPIEVSGISLDHTETVLTEGESLLLTATVVPGNATDKTLTWTSSDETVATVTDGVVKALKPGKSTITVSTTNGKAASCEITVVAKIVLVTSVTIAPAEIAAVEGTVITLVATVLPENATDRTLHWSSSDETVATVADGVVTIQGEGTAIVSASTNDGSGIKAECQVSGISWVEALENASATAVVYTIEGVLVNKEADLKTISSLPKGTYIIRIGNAVHKIIK